MTFNDYDDLVKRGIGKKILHSKEFGSYTGDIFYLLGTWKRPQFLVIGYGSCSACDDLAACVSEESYKSLAENVAKDIKRFSSFEKFIEWAADPDRAYEWYFHEDGFSAFIAECEELMKA